MKAEYVTFNPRGMPRVWLEGEVLDGGGRACVVSHPHPLAGGDMDNPIVVALWRAAAEAGFRALRYNFRGVGESSGELTENSPLATADLSGAIRFLGGGPVVAVGYSYGARCTLHALYDNEPIERSILVALPTRLPANRAAISNLILGRRIATEQYTDTPDLDLVANPPRPVLVVAGDHDPLVQIDALRARGVEPVVMEGVNHFFCRKLGNQEPADDDLAALAAHVVGFLRG